MEGQSRIIFFPAIGTVDSRETANRTAAYDDDHHHRHNDEFELDVS